MKNYNITEEQIKELANKFGSDNETCLRSGLSNQLKEWYPDVFEVKLEVGKWYKNEDYNNLVFMVDKFKEQNFESEFTTFAKGYGFRFNNIKEWYDDLHFSDSRKFTLATNSEVLEALTNEAKKRGFIDGVYFNIINGERDTIHIENNSRYGYDTFGNKLLMNGWCIFEKGNWSVTIPTITKEEAEKRLNAKIV